MMSVVVEAILTAPPPRYVTTSNGMMTHSPTSRQCGRSANHEMPSVSSWDSQDRTIGPSTDHAKQMAMGARNHPDVITPCGE
jgi:hypothetical protein